MNEPETIAELVSLDEGSLHFAPLGFIGGTLSPADALKTQRGAIARAVLHDDVTEAVRDNWSRLRKLYLYGLLEYELFSAAHDYALLVLEGAFRARFVSYYNYEIPVLSGGQVAMLSAPTFQSVYDARTTAQLFDGDPRAAERLPISLSQLFGWARRRGLLTGQRSQLSDEFFPLERNRVAHPDHHHLGMPPDASRVLNDIAEIINKLWGRETAGGRIFPGPLPRKLRVVAIAPDGHHAVEYSTVEQAAAQMEGRDWTLAVFRAAPEERLTAFGMSAPGSISFAHIEGYQTTFWPCDLIWGPRPGEQLIAQASTLLDRQWSDAVSFVDRLFVIREREGELDPPRSPEDLQALLLNSQDDHAGEVWHLIRADHPWDAQYHVRAHVVGIRPILITPGRCRECHVTYVAHLAGRPTVEDIARWARTS